MIDPSRIKTTKDVVMLPLRHLKSMLLFRISMKETMLASSWFFYSKRRLRGEIAELQKTLEEVEWLLMLTSNLGQYLDEKTEREHPSVQD